MSHPLEVEYGLTADELLDAIEKRFRAKVTLEGAVAEVHLEKRVRDLLASGYLIDCEVYDLDGQPDVLAVVPSGVRVLVECKNVRNDDGYKKAGKVVAYKVETQKTRTSNNDPSSRFYGADQFDVVAVCMGKKTGDWTQFLYARTDTLERHKKYPHKLAAMQWVPLPSEMPCPGWYETLHDVLETFNEIQ